MEPTYIKTLDYMAKLKNAHRQDCRYGKRAIMVQNVGKLNSTLRLGREEQRHTLEAICPDDGTFRVYSTNKYGAVDVYS